MTQGADVLVTADTIRTAPDCEAAKHQSVERPGGGAGGEWMDLGCGREPKARGPAWKKTALVS